MAVQYAIEHKQYHCIEYLMSKCPEPSTLPSNPYDWYAECAKHNALKALKIVHDLYKKIS